MQSCAMDDARVVTGKQSPVRLTARQGLISLFLLALAWAALDDITTDNATTFAFEYLCLIGIAAWFFSLFARFVMRGHRILGFTMTALLVATTVAIVILPPRGEPLPAWQPRLVYLAFAIYLVLSAWLIWPGIRRGGQGGKKLPQITGSDSE